MTEPHPIITNWVRQLLAVQDLVERTDGQIEVRLFANNGKVRKRPVVVLNAGPQEMEEP